MTKSKEFMDEPFDEQKIARDKEAIIGDFKAEIEAVLPDFIRRLRRHKGLPDIPVQGVDLPPESNPPYSNN